MQRNPKDSFAGTTDKDFKGKDQGPLKEESIPKDLNAPDSIKAKKGSKPSRWDKQPSPTAPKLLGAQYLVGNYPPMFNVNWQVWFTVPFWIIPFLCFYAWLNINGTTLWIFIVKKHILAYIPWLIWSKIQPLICNLYPLYCIVLKLTNKVLLYQAFQQDDSRSEILGYEMISFLMKILIVYPRLCGGKLKGKLLFLILQSLIF